MSSAADKLVARMETAARLSADEARQIAEKMCAEGIRSAAEAEALVDFNLRIAVRDADWAGQFQRALRDYVLLRTVPEGRLSDINFTWLRETFTPAGQVRNASELDVLIMLQRQAETVPAGYDLFVLKAVCDCIVREGSAGAANVARLYRVLATARPGRVAWISRAEARCLWKTNTDLGKAANDPSWNHLFARAIGNHLFASACPQPGKSADALSRETWLNPAVDTPGQLTAGLDTKFTQESWFELVSPSAATAHAAREAAAALAASQDGHTSGVGDWLRRRLGWDNAANQAERALVDFLNAEAPGLTAGLVVAAG